MTLLMLCPAGHAEEETVPVVLAQDHGLHPNTDEDQGPAFRELISRVIAADQPTVIQLEKGQYRISGGGRHFSALLIEKAKDLIIRGEGVESCLVMTDPREGAFFIGQSENVFIENLSIDYDPLPYTQGHILFLSRKEGWFDFVVQKSYPALDEPWFAEAPQPYGQWGMIFDRKKDSLKAGAADFIFMEKWEQVSQGVWRMYPVESQRDRLEDMQMGDRFVHLARHGKGGALFFWRSKNCGAENVTIYASQSLAAGSLESEFTRLKGIQVKRKGGCDRLITTNSDGVHSQQDIRGPQIEGCFFEAMADDGVNIYARPNRITVLISEKVIRIEPGGQLEAGDEIQIFDPEKGYLLYQGLVEEVGRQPDGDLRVGLKDNVEMIRPGAVNWQLYNLSRCGSGFLVKDSIFQNHRRHGMMLKSTQGLVENVRIRDVGGLGIVIGNDPDWPEGVIPSQINVSGLSVEAVGFSRWYGSLDRGAAIQILTKVLNGRAPASRAVSHIHLENTLISAPPGAALVIDGAEEVTIKNMDIHYTEEQAQPRACSAVDLRNAQKIYGEKISIDARSAAVEAGISIDSSVEPGEKGWVLNDYYFQGTSPSQAIRDQR
jgi:hypothetical protein